MILLLTGYDSSMTETGPKQFGGKKRQPVEFFVDEDKFFAAPKIPSDSMMDIIEKSSQLSVANVEETSSEDVHKMYQTALEMLEMVLYQESYELLLKRVRDKQNPIDINQVIEMVQWLLGEAYAIRPTQSSSHSTEQPNSDGTNSTGGQQASALSTMPLPGTGSSI